MFLLNVSIYIIIINLKKILYMIGISRIEQLTKYKDKYK